MSKDPAKTWFRVTELRERRSQQSLARVQSDLVRARERLRRAEAEREAELSEARPEAGTVVSAATLGLYSQALEAGRQRVVQAERDAESFEQPVEAARESLEMSTRQRMIAQKWLARRAARQRVERDRKEQRAADDLTAARAATPIR